MRIKDVLDVYNSINEEKYTAEGRKSKAPYYVASSLIKKRMGVYTHIESSISEVNNDKVTVVAAVTTVQSESDENIAIEKSELEAFKLFVLKWGFDSGIESVSDNSSKAEIITKLQVKHS
jgi:hypothetical protein